MPRPIIPTLFLIVRVMSVPSGNCDLNLSPCNSSHLTTNRGALCQFRLQGGNDSAPLLCRNEGRNFQGVASARVSGRAGMDIGQLEARESQMRLQKSWRSIGQQLFRGLEKFLPHPTGREKTEIATVRFARFVFGNCGKRVRQKSSPGPNARRHP